MIKLQLNHSLCPNFTFSCCVIVEKECQNMSIAKTCIKPCSDCSKCMLRIRRIWEQPDLDSWLDMTHIDFHLMKIDQHDLLSLSHIFCVIA